MSKTQNSQDFKNNQSFYSLTGQFVILNDSILFYNNEDRIVKYDYAKDKLKDVQTKVTEQNSYVPSVTYLLNHQNQLIAGQSDGEVLIQDLENDVKSILSVNNESAITNILVINYIDQPMLIVSTNNCQIYLMDFNGKKINKLKISFSVKNILYSSTNNLTQSDVLIVSTLDGTINLIDLCTFTILNFVKTPNIICDIVLLSTKDLGQSRSNEMILITVSKDKLVRIYSLDEENLSFKFESSIERQNSSKAVSSKIIIENNKYYLVIFDESKYAEVLKIYDNLKFVKKQKIQFNKRKRDQNFDTFNDQIKTVKITEIFKFYKKLSLNFNYQSSQLYKNLLQVKSGQLMKILSLKKESKPELQKSDIQSDMKVINLKTFKNSKCIQAQDNNIQITKIENINRKIATIEFKDVIKSFEIQDDKLLFVSYSKGYIKIQELLEQTEIYDSQIFENELSNLTFLQSGINNIYLTCTSKNNLLIYKYSKNKLKLQKKIITEDEIVQIKSKEYEPNNKTQIACALMNTNIILYKIEKSDKIISEKSILTFQGNNLPCTSLDISQDNLKLISSSADKSIRLYSMDFGETLKVFNLAHEHGVTDVNFIFNTHIACSVGRDNALKIWDCDKNRLLFQYYGMNMIHPLKLASSEDQIILYSKSILTFQRSESQTVQPEIENQMNTHNEQLNEKDQAKKFMDEGDEFDFKNTQQVQKAQDVLQDLVQTIHKQEKTKTRPDQFLNDSCDVFIVKEMKRIPNLHIESAIQSLSVQNALLLLKQLKNLIEDNVWAEVSVGYASMILKHHWDRMSLNRYNQEYLNELVQFRKKLEAVEQNLDVMEETLTGIQFLGQILTE